MEEFFKKHYGESPKEHNGVISARGERILSNFSINLSYVF